MACYEPAKQALARDLNPQAAFLGAGALAGLAASCVRVPTEVIKQRIQTGEFNSARNAVLSITRREGSRGLFAGYGAFLLRDLPFDAIEFWAFDTLKINYQRAVRRDLHAVEASACGAVAGAITGALPCCAFETQHVHDIHETSYMSAGSASSVSLESACGSRLCCVQRALRRVASCTVSNPLGLSPGAPS